MLKKTFVLTLAVIIVITSAFTACSKKESDKTSDTKADTTEQGLVNTENEIGFATVVVTDEKGKAVTDEKGKKVTTEAAVVYEDGKAYLLGSDGEKATNSKGKYVTVKAPTTKPADDVTLKTNTTKKSKQTTKRDVALTASPQTTKFDGEDIVPSLSQDGKEINFNESDMAIIERMLEVPYLYLADYENNEGVPIEIAAHVAVWMAEHEGSTRTVYPSSPVVLNLFKFFGQTVVHFKTKCNDYAPDAMAPISYNAKDDTFTISEFTPKKQDVKITKIEDLGNNNYYKITGKVSSADGKKNVVAIVQKNRLDVTLGFSIKALKWSE